MLTVARYAIARVLARLHRLSFARDPVLLQGREGRWRWPWAINGLLLTALLFVLLSFVVIFFEDVAVRQNWVRGGFPQNVFPLDPAQPITYVDVLIASLPFLLAPLIALPLAHGVSWRRAFSYGVGFQWGQFWRAALALLLLAMLALMLGYALEPQQYQFPARSLGHALWIALALGVIFVQSLGEEVLFRGYLLRAWGAVIPFRLPVTAAVIAIFVTGHLWNEDLQRDLLLNVIYFVVGEIIAYAVLFRTQNLAASAGLHWMNNVLALVTPTVPGQPTVLGLAIYTDPVYVAGGSRLFDPLTHTAGIVGVALLLTMLFWRRSPFYLAPPAPGETTAPAAEPSKPSSTSDFADAG
jgi:membrane protease YdiL (CAAX protease family)